MDLLKSITHPDEVYALLKYKLGAGPTKTNPNLVSIIIFLNEKWNNVYVSEY